jgi:hypothetical protein
MVDRMLGHPFGNADLALDHAALKRNIALVAVGDDFFDTTAGASRQNMTENGNKRHEHQTSSFRQLPHAKLMPAADVRARRAQPENFRRRRESPVVNLEELQLKRSV